MQAFQKPKNFKPKKQKRFHEKKELLSPKVLNTPPITFFNKYTYLIKINNQSITPMMHWQHQWKNLHLMYKSVIVHTLLLSFFLKRKLYLNNFFYHKYHGGLRFVGNTFGFYNPKLSKVFKKYKKHKLFFQKKLLFFKRRRQVLSKQQKKKTYSLPKIKFLSQPKILKEFLNTYQSSAKLSHLAKGLLAYNKSPKLCISFTHYYVPKTYILPGSDTAFSRLKTIQNFWHGLQLIRLVVENKANAQMLVKFVYLSIRRNPKRAAFIMHLKRIIDWHFASTENLQIQGIRIEVKGRFNAKSRARKYILSVGRVAKQEKTSHVDYAFSEAFTPFGSLGIKVWICPEINKNVITTTQNKVSKSTQRSN